MTHASRKEDQTSAAGEAAPLAGPVVGWIAGAGGDGTVLVDFEGNAGGPLPARSTVALDGDAVLAALGSRQGAVLLFERGDPARPLIIGLVGPPLRRAGALPHTEPRGPRARGLGRPRAPCRPLVPCALADGDPRVASERQACGLAPRGGRPHRASRGWPRLRRPRPLPPGEVHGPFAPRGAGGLLRAGRAGARGRSLPRALRHARRGLDPRTRSCDRGHERIRGVPLSCLEEQAQARGPPPPRPAGRARGSPRARSGRRGGPERGL